MPHVSKRELTKNEFRQIYKNFLELVVRSKDKELMDRFFWEFLTPTEKIMLSKRLAIVCLLEKGLSSYEIWNMLKVSSSTVDRIGKYWERGKYAHIVKILKNSDSKLWKAIEKVADILTPHPYHVSKKKFLEYKRKHGF